LVIHALASQVFLVLLLIAAISENLMAAFFFRLPDLAMETP
jgi:hypothetical protein